MRDGALSRGQAERFVEEAAAAPSTHNLQPWRFVARLAERVIEIYADPTRTLRRADPHGRAVHIACGAALFNLRLAIASAGAEPVARLLPNPRDPLLLAAVRVAGPHRPQPGEQDLHAAIQAARGGQRSHRPARPAGAGLIGALAEAAALEGATLSVLDHVQALRILALAAPEAPARPGAFTALAEFRPGPAEHGWGRSELRPGQGDRRRPPLLPPGARLALVSTAADDRASWLRAGQALQRVLLLAAHAGVPAAPLGFALEAPAARRRADPSLGPGYPETVLRLGPDPLGADGHPSQRRPIGHVMRVVGGASMGPAVGGPSGGDREDEGPRPALRPALHPAARHLLSSK